MDYFNQIASNPWAWCFMAIIAILSLILAFRSIPQKRIKCIVTHSWVILEEQSSFSKLLITYDGKQVDRLIVTKVVFWNSSFFTIDRNDLIEAAPFTILFKNGNVLDLSVLKGDTTPNSIEISKINENVVKVMFEYLDRKEGGIIQIIHTGDVINISKTIKGGKIIPRSSNTRSKIIWISLFISSILISLVILYIVVSLFPNLHLFLQTFVSIFICILLWVPIANRIFDTIEFIPKNCKGK